MAWGSREWSGALCGTKRSNVALLLIFLCAEVKSCLALTCHTNRFLTPAHPLCVHMCDSLDLGNSRPRLGGGFHPTSLRASDEGTDACWLWYLCQSHVSCEYLTYVAMSCPLHTWPFVLLCPGAGGEAPGSPALSPASRGAPETERTALRGKN